MNALTHDRGLALLAAHCLDRDPATQTARERLDAAIGPEFAHKLVFALSGSGPPDNARSRGVLGVRHVFAA